MTAARHIEDHAGDAECKRGGHRRQKPAPLGAPGPVSARARRFTSTAARPATAPTSKPEPIDSATMRAAPIP